MATSSPATLDQGKKVLDLLQGYTSQQVQNFVSNGDLLKPMLNADLTKVDRSAFNAVLTSALASIPWRSVSEYAERIAARSQLCGWGFTKTQIDALAARLVDHADPLKPTGITMWLGRDLGYNWEQAMAWLKDGVEALGEKFTPYVGAGRVSFYPGSEQSGRRKLAVALLDLATYWDPINGVVPNKVRGIEKRLPGLEVAWLLALNPEVYVAIDYKTIPGLIATGLVVDSGLVPRFARGSDGAFVHGRWAGNRWLGGSVVRFRK